MCSINAGPYSTYGPASMSIPGWEIRQMESNMVSNIKYRRLRPAALVRELVYFLWQTQMHCAATVILSAMSARLSRPIYCRQWRLKP